MSDEIKISKYSSKYYDQYYKLYKEFEHIEVQKYPDRNDSNENIKKIVDNNIEEHHKRNLDIFILFRENYPIGFISGHISEDIENKNPSYYIEDLFVTEKERGRGYGTLLLNTARTHAKKLGLKKFGLTVLVKNQDAYRLYKREGFEDYSISLVKDI